MSNYSGRSKTGGHFRSGYLNFRSQFGRNAQGTAHLINSIPKKKRFGYNYTVSSGLTRVETGRHCRICIVRLKTRRSTAIRSYYTTKPQLHPWKKREKLREAWGKYKKKWKICRFHLGKVYAILKGRPGFWMLKCGLYLNIFWGERSFEMELNLITHDLRDFGMQTSIYCTCLV